MITVSVDVYRLAPYVPCVELVFSFKLHLLSMIPLSRQIEILASIGNGRTHIRACPSIRMYIHSQN
jgi:hypothetical protein